MADVYLHLVIFLQDPALVDTVSSLINAILHQLQPHVSTHTCSVERTCALEHSTELF